ncbi:MAG: hypothetical protein EXS01_00770 [Phycisphaerales bacterium]|nr:hypothetical protein [Phycisphaerales bacterium]
MTHSSTHLVHHHLRALAISAFLACPAISFAQDPAAPTPPPTVPAAAPLPTATEIFAKAVTAAGGADLIRQQTSRTSTGTIEMPAQSLKGTLHTKSLAPDLLIVETEIKGFGKIMQGINGKVGWSSDPVRGTSLMEADALERETRDLSIEQELNPALDCSEVVVVGRSDFRGTACYEVRLKCGADASTRFYSVDSGHLVGLVRQAKTPMGELEVVVAFRDFAAFSGRTLAKVQEITMMGQVQIVSVNSVDFAPIDPSAFKLSKEIQALVDAATSQAAPAGTAPASSTPPASAPTATTPAPTKKK